MDILRNVSGQPIIIYQKLGVRMHLLPGNAVTLTEEEQKSPQIQNLLQRGLVNLEKLPKPQEKQAPKIEKQEAKKSEAKSEEKKAESPAPQ